MLRISLAALAMLVALVAAYLLLAPVPIEPLAWQAPPVPGYAGPLAPNTRLAGLQDPSGKYPETTSVTDTADRLHIQSLHAPALGWIGKTEAGGK